MERRATPSGITLVECLVVISIIGLLVSLALPAIQRAREAARSTQCASNLHNIGLALNGHISDYGGLPRGHFRRGDGMGTWTFSFFSPHSRILHYLEESAIFNAINFQLGEGAPFEGRLENSTGQHMLIGIFVCPSDAEAGRWNRNSYRANTGPEADPYGTPWRGLQTGSFTSLYQAIRPQDFTDGMSNTVLSPNGRSAMLQNLRTQHIEICGTRRVHCPGLFHLPTTWLNCAGA